MVHGLSKGSGSTAVFRKNYILKSSVHFYFHLCFLFGAKTPPSCDTSYCSIRANCRSSVKAFWTIYSYLPTRTWYLISPSVHRHFQKIFDLRWSSDLRGWRSQQSSWNAQQHQSQNVLFFPSSFLFLFPSSRTMQVWELALSMEQRWHCRWCEGEHKEFRIVTSIRVWERSYCLLKVIIFLFHSLIKSHCFTYAPHPPSIVA